VLTLEEAILQFGREKRNGRRVVFTNGCFDLLHPGHIAQPGTGTRVGRCADRGSEQRRECASIESEGRPVIAERERAEFSPLWNPWTPW